MKKVLMLFLLAGVFSTVDAQEKKVRSVEDLKLKKDAEALKKIGLNETEGRELRSINKDFRSKAVALKDNSTLTKEQRLKEMKKLDNEKLARIKTTLGEEKYARYDQWKKKERAHIKEMRKRKAERKSLQ